MPATRRTAAQYALGTLAFAAAGGVGAGLRWWKAERARPRLHLPTPRVDFGTVPAGQEVSRTVRVENRGDAPLRFARVISHCGCTGAELSRPVVPPGGSADLTLRLTGRGRGGTQSTAVEVWSDDPDVPRVLLPVAYVPVPEPFTEPAVLDFGRVPRAELPVTRTLTLLSAEDPGPVAATLDGRDLRVERVPGADAGGRAFAVTLPAGVPTGMLADTVRLAAQDAGTSLAVSVLGAVEGPAYALPGSVLLTPGRAERVVLRGRDGAGLDAGLTVTRVRPDGFTAGEPAVTVRAATDDGVPLLIEWPPGTGRPPDAPPPARSVGRLLVDVRAADAGVRDTVAVPVTALLRRG